MLPTQKNLSIAYEADRVIETANIDLRPDQRQISSEVNEITIGDLHANAIKFIYTLVREGICNISDVDYNSLVKLYSEADVLCQQIPTEISLQRLSKFVAQFEKIVKELVFYKKAILIRLLGDILSDRGSNDYFILLILEALHKNNISVRIILSNHDGNFIQAYEHYDERGKMEGRLIKNEARGRQSLINLGFLIMKKIVSFENIQTLVEGYYKPKLVLLDCSLDIETNAITIFSHAPVGLAEISLLSEKMIVSFNDQTSLALNESIQEINDTFKQLYIDDPERKISSLYIDLSNNYPASPITPTTPGSPVKNRETVKSDFATVSDIVKQFMWNRNYAIYRPARHNDYSMFFVHGHDSSKMSRSTHICNLNNALGMHGINNHYYTVFIRAKPQLLEKQKEKSFIQNYLPCMELENSGFYFACLALSLGVIYLTMPNQLSFFKPGEQKDIIKSSDLINVSRQKLT